MLLCILCPVSGTCRRGSTLYCPTHGYFCFRRYSLADPQALTVANNVFRAIETIGYPECGINLAHGVSYLALALQRIETRIMAIRLPYRRSRKTGNLPIPLQIRNAPTQLMKDLEYGKGYEMYTKESLLPEKIKGHVILNSLKKCDMI